MTNHCSNLTRLLSSDHNCSKYLISVNENIEIFRGIAQVIWSISGPLICLVNLIILILICKINQSQRIYYLMQINCVFKMILGLIYTFIGDTTCVYCTSNYYNSLPVLIYKSYIVTTLGDIISVSIGATEVLITLDRLSIFKSTLDTNFFKRQDLKYIIPIIILTGTIVCIPDLFIIDINYISDGLYQRELNSFSNSVLYNNVFISIRSLYLLVLLVMYVKLVTLLLGSHNKFLARKRRRLKTYVRKNDRDLTKLILFQSVFNNICSFVSVGVQVIGRFEYKIKAEHPNDYYVGDLIIARTTIILVGLCCLWISDIAIFAYDSRIRKLYKKKQGQSQLDQ